MYQFEFSGRCPSAAQLRAHIKRAVAAGPDWIQLIWGENQITIERRAGHGLATGGSAGPVGTISPET